MAKIETGTQTVTVTEYKAVEVEPNNKINATYGGWVPKDGDESAREFLEELRAMTGRRGQTATSRIVLIRRDVTTRTVIVS